jgi:hypothetical protein
VTAKKKSVNNESKLRPIMNLPANIERLVRAPTLTRTRIVLALAVAVVADGLQILLGPLGWVFADEIIDLVAMALTVWAVGFHVLLLPPFLIEFVPLVDMLPTWTGCVAAVIVLRKRQQRATPPVVDVPPLANSPPQLGSGQPNHGSDTRPR